MRGEFVCATEAYAPWSLGFRQTGSHFHVVERGTAWLMLDGDEKPTRISAGDLIILPLGGGHVLCSDPAIPSLSIEQAIADNPTPGSSIFRTGGDGEDTHLVCGRFYFAGVLAPRLLALLPKLIRIEPTPGRPLEWLRLTSHFLIDETRNPRPGSAIMIARLLDLLFIQAIREWGASGPGERGWLGGLTDPQIGRALSALHEEPARDWTVEALAEIAALSRSAFAARFTAVVGQTPLRYLASWRLDLAADHLRVGVARVGEIARSVGYGSEAALTRAFKAQFGTTPAAFSRGAGRQDDITQETMEGDRSDG
jgi:AraC-like DNA-binding protein